MGLFNFNFSKPKVSLGEVAKFYTGSPNRALGKDQDFAKPLISTWQGREYVPFGIDNLYPYLLLDLYHGSAFHRAIMEFKTRTVMGDGLEIICPSKTLKDKMAVEKLHSILSKAFFKRFTQEFLIHDRIYIKVHRKGSEVSNNILIVPAEKVRISNEERGYEKGFFLNDWKRGYLERDFIIPFDKYNTEDKTQIIQFQELTPGFEIYAVPAYISGSDWIWLDSQIAYYQKQNMQNSLNPSAILKIYEKFANKDQEKEYVENLQDSFTSARNAGKVMTFVSRGKELAPEVTMAEPNKLDKAFAGVQESIVKNVARAHLVNPALMGIETAGKLGTSNELNEAYELYKKVWLDSTQDQIEEFLQDLVKKIGYTEATVRIKRKNNLVDPNNEIKTL